MVPDDQRFRYANTFAFSPFSPTEYDPLYDLNKGTSGGMHDCGWITRNTWTYTSTHAPSCLAGMEHPGDERAPELK